MQRNFFKTKILKTFIQSHPVKSKQYKTLHHATGQPGPISVSTCATSLSAVDGRYDRWRNDRWTSQRRALTSQMTTIPSMLLRRPRQGQSPSSSCFSECLHSSPKARSPEQAQRTERGATVSLPREIRDSV